MNAIPMYSIWSANLGTWAGGSATMTMTSDLEEAIEKANSFRYLAPFHVYSVIETWGEGNRVIYETLPMIREIMK
jgi:hypothetical protein